jgi:hypothetical protein
VTHLRVMRRSRAPRPLLVVCEPVVRDTKEKNTASSNVFITQFSWQQAHFDFVLPKVEAFVPHNRKPIPQTRLAVKIETIQRRLALPLRKDDTKKSRMVSNFLRSQ